MITNDRGPFLSEHKLTYYLKHDRTRGNALTKLSALFSWFVLLSKTFAKSCVGEAVVLHITSSRITLKKILCN